MDTLQAGCIPLWDRNSLKLFSAISQNNPSKQVIDFNLIVIYFVILRSRVRFPEMDRLR